MAQNHYRIGNEYPPDVTADGKQFRVNSKCLWKPFLELTKGKAVTYDCQRILYGRYLSIQRVAVLSQALAAEVVIGFTEDRKLIDFSLMKNRRGFQIDNLNLRFFWNIVIIKYIWLKDMARVATSNLC